MTFCKVTARIRFTGYLQGWIVLFLLRAEHDGVVAGQTVYARVCRCDYGILCTDKGSIGEGGGRYRSVVGYTLRI